MNALLPNRTPAPLQMDASMVLPPNAIQLQLSGDQYRELLRSMFAVIPMTATRDYDEWGDQLEED
jgi:hypothetical protein